jgi:small subunit ribosomal protein S21
MIIIDLKKEKNLESALKTLKNKVQKIRLLKELRERKEFIKPSVQKRKSKQKAIYTQKIKNGLN